MRRLFGKRPHPQRGQALVLFAVTLIALIGLIGLSIDGLRVYIKFGEAQRAAEAAALAGVLYLPAFPNNTARAPDGNDATDRAYQEAAKNNFTDHTAITVTATSPTTITVSIHISVPLTLIALLNPAPATSDAVASAIQLSPIALGDNSGAVGDNSNYTASITGLNELKEHGDPSSVLCEDGWSQASDIAHSDAISAIYTSRLGSATNMPQYLSGPNCSPGTPGNPDMISPSFGGLTTSGRSITGQSYLVTIPPGTTNAALWVWNPRFTNSDSGTPDQFFAGEKPFSNHFLHDALSYYPQMTYSLYRVSRLYDRSADVPIAAIWPSADSTSVPDTTPFPALDNSHLLRMPSLDLAFLDDLSHLCFAKAWNPAGSCISTPSDIGRWVKMPLPEGLNAASVPVTYRLTVSNTNGSSAGYGQHDYGLKLCNDQVSLPPSCASGGTTVTAWHSQTLRILTPARSVTLPLAFIPATYVGRQVQLDLFNSGVGPGNITIQILPPVGSGTISYPALTRFSTTGAPTAIQTSLASDSRYHGKWLHLTLTLPPDYSGGEWQMQAMTDSPTFDATMTVAASLIGPAISLIG